MKVSLLVVPVLCLTLSACVYVPFGPRGGGGGKAGGGTSVVCHKDKKTMELPNESVQAHLDHGDRRGPC